MRGPCPVRGTAATAQAAAVQNAAQPCTKSCCLHAASCFKWGTAQAVTGTWLGLACKGTASHPPLTRSTPQSAPQQPHRTVCHAAGTKQWQGYCSTASDRTPVHRHASTTLGALESSSVCWQKLQLQLPRNSPPEHALGSPNTHHQALPFMQIKPAGQLQPMCCCWRLVTESSTALKSSLLG